MPAKQYYLQEAETMPWNMYTPLVACDYTHPKYFRKSYGSVAVWYKGEYGRCYLPLREMEGLAAHVLKRYGSRKALERLYTLFDRAGTHVEKMYLTHSYEDVDALSDKKLLTLLARVQKTHLLFWSLGIFVDAFDAGADQRAIRTISQKYSLAPEEVAVLTTPLHLTYVNESVLALCELAQKVRGKKMAPTQLKTASVAYRRKFDYTRSNYSYIKHLDERTFERELKAYTHNDKKFRETFHRLKAYDRNQNRAIQTLLSTHGLKENPLWFFQQLTYWREHRKKINLMGMHVFDMVLESIARRTLTEKKYLQHALPTEVAQILTGDFDISRLKKRYHNGVVMTACKGSIKIAEGDRGTRLKKELDKRLAHLSRATSEKVLVGQAASLGYAQGIARIILGQKDFPSFSRGEILVTTMTRPEFMPVMERASAFVTNEGGITCHAAIVSREMKKPCIIGTKNATITIHNGDIIEVDANIGTVRIVKEAL